MASSDTSVSQNKHAIGVFSSYRETETALLGLRTAGFPMDIVSVLAQEADQQDNIAGVGISDHLANNADESATTGAALGVALGGFSGLLLGLSALTVPSLSPIVFAGTKGSAIANTLADGEVGTGVNSLLGALVSLGVPEAQGRLYNDRVSGGEHLVIIHGSDSQTHYAEAILNTYGIQDWGIYDVPMTSVRQIEKP